MHELTQAEHARIRRGLALIPVCVWLVYAWISLFVPVSVGLTGLDPNELRDFATFYAEFQRYAAEAAWTDEQRLPSLRQGISFELKTALAYSDRDPETLADWVALCQRLDNKIRSLKSRQNARASSSWRTPTPTTMTTATAKATTTTTPTNVKTAVTGTHAGPMTLLLGATRNKVLVEEYARR